MPIYYFDIADDGVCIDEEGADCADDAKARRLAMRSLSSIVADALHNGGDGQDFTILVRAADGRSIYSGTLSYGGRWTGRRT